MSPLAPTHYSNAPIAEYRHAQLAARRGAASTAECLTGLSQLNPALTALIRRRQMEARRTVQRRRRGVSYHASMHVQVADRSAATRRPPQAAG